APFGSPFARVYLPGTSSAGSSLSAVRMQPASPGTSARLSASAAGRRARPHGSTSPDLHHPAIWRSGGDLSTLLDCRLFATAAGPQTAGVPMASSWHGRGEGCDVGLAVE